MNRAARNQQTLATGEFATAEELWQSNSASPPLEKIHIPIPQSYRTTFQSTPSKIASTYLSDLTEIHPSNSAAMHLSNLTELHFNPPFTTHSFCS
jgi:hypothetical protein